jgi:hypothetical protein
MSELKSPFDHASFERFNEIVPPFAGLGGDPPACLWCGSEAHGSAECPTCPEYDEESTHGW